MILQVLSCTICLSAVVLTLILQVSSSEAAFRNDPNEYLYNTSDARICRSSVTHGGIPYIPPHDLPPVPSHEILSPYRGGPAYSYATKPFYSGVPAYSMGYVEELPDYPINSSSQPVLGQDMMPYPSWTSRGDYGYAGATTSLVHRPAPSVAVDSANFSLSNMATHLPGSSLGSSDRLLPAPSSRSVSYPSSQTYKALPPAGGTDPSPVDAAAVLADMASSSYGGSFDTSSLPYNSSTTSLQTQATQSSRTKSEAYSPDTDSIFTEHEHSLRSQGSAVDLHAYTYSGSEPGGRSLRRGSAASGGLASASSSHGGNTSNGGKGSTSSSSSSSSSVANIHHGYMNLSSIHDSTSNPHHHHVQLAATAAVSGGTPSAAYLAESPVSTGGDGSPTTCSGRVHRDARRGPVGGRR